MISIWESKYYKVDLSDIRFLTHIVIFLNKHISFYSGAFGVRSQKFTTALPSKITNVRRQQTKAPV